MKLGSDCENKCDILAVYLQNRVILFASIFFFSSRKNRCLLQVLELSDKLNLLKCKIRRFKMNNCTVFLRPCTNFVGICLLVIVTNF